MYAVHSSKLHSLHLLTRSVISIHSLALILIVYTHVVFSGWVYQFIVCNALLYCTVSVYSGDLRGGDGELGCLCGKAGTSHLCDGSAHSSGCVVNGSNAMAAV